MRTKGAGVLWYGSCLLCLAGKAGHVHMASEETRVYDLTVEVEEEEGLYLAQCLELDISSFGETFEEAKEMIEDAMRGFLETASLEETERRIADYQQRRDRNVYKTQIQVPVTA